MTQKQNGKAMSFLELCELSAATSETKIKSEVAIVKLLKGFIQIIKIEDPKKSKYQIMGVVWVIKGLLLLDL